MKKGAVELRGFQASKYETGLSWQCKGYLKFFFRCQSPDGGFGGGPGQFPHLAATYAAVNALVILGTEEAYNVIDR